MKKLQKIPILCISGIHAWTYDKGYKPNRKVCRDCGKELKCERRWTIFGDDEYWYEPIKAKL